MCLQNDTYYAKSEKIIHIIFSEGSKRILNSELYFTKSPITLNNINFLHDRSGLKGNNSSKFRQSTIFCFNMSLVAYGSSDDSDVSDAEESQADGKPVQSPQAKIPGPQSANEQDLVLEEQFSDSDSELEEALVRNNSDATDLDHMLKGEWCDFI